jgi:hypothetical protein
MSRPLIFRAGLLRYSQEACDSGTVRLADSIALTFAAVPSRNTTRDTLSNSREPEQVIARRMG